MTNKDKTYTQITAAQAIEAGGVVRHYKPESKEIADLISRATEHPLGVEFLRDGALDSVAATFSVHAFVVEQARQTIQTGLRGVGDAEIGVMNNKIAHPDAKS